MNYIITCGTLRYCYGLKKASRTKRSVDQYTAASKIAMKVNI